MLRESVFNYNQLEHVFLRKAILVRSTNFNQLYDLYDRMVVTVSSKVTKKVDAYIIIKNSFFGML